MSNESERKYVFRIKVGEPGDIVSYHQTLPAKSVYDGEFDRLCDLLDKLPQVDGYSIITKGTGVEKYTGRVQQDHE